MRRDRYAEAYGMPLAQGYAAGLEANARLRHSAQAATRAQKAACRRLDGHLRRTKRVEPPGGKRHAFEFDDATECGLFRAKRV